MGRSWARLALVLVMIAPTAMLQPGAAGQAASIEFGATPGGAGDNRIAELNEFESQVDRPLDFVRVFELWDSPFPTAYHDLLVDTDHRMLLSVRAKRRDGSFVLWRDIADAQPGSPVYDEMVAWVTAVGDLGVPVWFSFNHEPEIVENIANGTDQDFVDAWNRIVDEFAIQGVTNAEFVWIMTDFSFRVPADDWRHAPNWYPGDQTVDLIGADAYNYADCRPLEPIAWRPFEDAIDDFRAFGLAHPDKGLIVSEWASTEAVADAGAAKSAWIDEAALLLAQPGWEQIVAVSYFNYPDPNHPDCAWDIDSTPAALDAVQAMASDPFFGGGAPASSGILFAVADPGAISAGDAAAILRLEAQGAVVTVVDDDAVTAGSASRADLVWISSTVNTVPLASTFRHVDSPVIVAKPWLLDDMSMTGTAGGVDYGIASVTDIVIADPSHALAAGLAGTVPYTTTSRLAQFGVPGSGATVVAEVAGQPATFVYEAGDALADGSISPGCRIGFSMYQNAPTVFTDDAWTLFDAVAEYALAGCAPVSGNEPPHVTITSPLDDAEVEGAVSISADASDSEGVVQVEFSVDGALISVDSDGADGWSTTWDASGIPDGTSVVISAAATDTDAATATDSVTVTVSTTDPREVLFIAGNASSLNSGEIAVSDRLGALGFLVTIVDDDNATAGASDGVDLVLISSTVDTGVVGTTFVAVTEAVWVSKPWLLDDMGMTSSAAGTDYGTESTKEVTISDPDHPMAAGMSGTVSFTTAPRLTQFGVLGADGHTVAAIDSGSSSFVYESGDQLADGSNAIGCRIGFSVFQTAPVKFTDAAWTLFDATAEYAAAGCPPEAGGPTVAITSPGAGSTISGTVTVIVTATATAVDEVEFFADGSSLGIDSDGTDGWSITWDSTAVPDGAVSLSATATDLDGTAGSDSHSISVTVDNAEDASVAFVVGDGDALTSGEDAVVAQLQSLTMTVTPIDDESATAQTAEAVDLVVISSTVNSGVLGTTFAAVTTPVWISKPWLLDDMGMTGPSANVDFGTVSASDITITDAIHPLAAGHSGDVPFTSSSRSAQFGVPAGDAIVIATVADQPMLFAYEAGASLADGTSAAGCRIAFSIFQSAPTKFTVEAWALFDAVAFYAIDGCADN